MIQKILISIMSSSKSNVATDYRNPHGINWYSTSFTGLELLRYTYNRERSIFLFPRY